MDDVLYPLSPPEYKRSRHEIKKKSSDTMKLQKKARKEFVDHSVLCPWCLSLAWGTEKGGMRGERFIPSSPDTPYSSNHFFLSSSLFYVTLWFFLVTSLLPSSPPFVLPCPATCILSTYPIPHSLNTMPLPSVSLSLLLVPVPCALPPGSTGRGDLQPQLDSAMHDVNDMYLLMEETEKQAVRRALVEERGRFCTFIGFLQPVVNGEIAMLGEITHLQAIIDDLTVLTTDPHKLPPASEQVPTLSSLYCIFFGSSFATFRPALSHTGSIRPLSVILPASPPYNYSPGSNTTSPTSKVPCWKDWSKAGSYEQPLAATLQRRKEPLDRLKESEASPGSQGYAGAHPDDVQRSRMTPATIAAKHGEEVSPAASDLAMVLTRGLSMEQQKSNRDSLQYSSGYSTQTTTPSCSEDTIPSQGSDYDCYSVNGDAEAEASTDFDKSSTIPRHSNIGQNYRRMIQTKRPASTAGLPSGAQGGVLGGGGGIGTPGTATIRRTPSTKPGVRRTLSNAGPIPIRPPIVPVKTPTVPDAPGGYPGPPVRVGSEECVFYVADDSSPNALEYVKASPKRLSLPNTAWGSGGAMEMSVYVQHGSEEDQMIAANRHSLVEKIGELVASAHALGEGQFPYPNLPDDPPPGPAPQHDPQAPGSGTDVLVSIRRGVRLRKTVSNDRSAPRIL
ncbi:unnamed protein product [Oncorhynchus mykiss]|uniref:WH2 domain-containing protein n=1 Tax=Oncorhynchus mykiss TaxID=8022 RepID=A0A060VY16_ONCMY|nr:unnamed protein product [Oncorhynchus mykiss]